MYSETQRPRFFSWRLALFIVPIWGVGLAGIGNIDARLLLVCTLLAAIPAAAVMKVSVDGGNLRIRVYGIPIRTTPLDRIDDVVVRDLSAAQEHAWSTFSAATYNWAGLRWAVEFREAGKGRVRIGTRTPDVLTQAITDG
jgi:hypothetical protein